MTFALDYQGLMLPTATYSTFMEYLSSSFFGNVLESVGGYWTINQECNSLTSVLDGLAFVFNISTSEKSQPLLILPLSNFAITYIQNNEWMCQLQI